MEPAVQWNHRVFLPIIFAHIAGTNSSYGYVMCEMVILQNVTFSWRHRHERGGQSISCMWQKVTVHILQISYTYAHQHWRDSLSCKQQIVLGKVVQQKPLGHTWYEMLLCRLFIDNFTSKSDPNTRLRIDSGDKELGYVCGMWPDIVHKSPRSCTHAYQQQANVMSSTEYKKGFWQKSFRRILLTFQMYIAYYILPNSDLIWYFDMTPGTKILI